MRRQVRNYENMRSTPLLPDSYYHVYNRGNQKQQLFFDSSDYARFLFIILYFQSDYTFPQISRQVKKYKSKKDFGVSQKVIDQIIDTRQVRLINFCIMPNHFHLTVHTSTAEDLSRYMHRVGNAYAKYFNTKYQKTGHVFQGAYKITLVETDEQLVRLSAYIHNNSAELPVCRGDHLLYQWSSGSDYLQNNRWGDLIDRTVVTESFVTVEDYEEYVLQELAKKYSI